MSVEESRGVDFDDVFLGYMAWGTLSGLPIRAHVMHFLVRPFPPSYPCLPRSRLDEVKASMFALLG